jgi:hypothetical protein
VGARQDRAHGGVLEQADELVVAGGDEVDLVPARGEGVGHLARVLEEPAARGAGDDGDPHAR